MKTKTSNHSIFVNAIAQATRKKTGVNDWGERQYQAYLFPRQGPERMIKDLIEGWLHYADQYHQWPQASETLAQDYYAGPYWLTIGCTINAMLSHERGRFDGGTLSEVIRDSVYNEGFTEEDFDTN